MIQEIDGYNFKKASDERITCLFVLSGIADSQSVKLKNQIYNINTVIEIEFGFLKEKNYGY